MIQKKKKLIILCLITILFVVQNVNLEAVLGTNLVEAASISLNRSSLNLLVGNSYTLRMNGTTKKGKFPMRPMKRLWMS